MKEDLIRFLTAIQGDYPETVKLINKLFSMQNCEQISKAVLNILDQIQQANQR